MEKPKQKVLIVEDSATQRELLRHVLSTHGYTATAANSADDALDQIRASPPDVVITDIVMPGMNGFELCRRIKSEPSFEHLPVILLTSLRDPKDVIRGLECGADNFIVKPFDEGYLLSRLQYVLSNAALASGERAGPIEVVLDGTRYTIHAQRRQVIDLLMSTYEAAVRKNAELEGAQEQLRAANAKLEAKVRERTAELESANIDLRGQIDERAKAEAALRETIGELEAFSYSLSHDMRAPLRAMMSFGQLLLDEYGPKLDSTGIDYLQRITSAALRLDTLIHDMLTYSHVLRADIKLTPTDLDPLLRQIVAERPNLSDAQITVKRPLLPLMAHPAAITQCLTNLLDNAVKFARRNQTPEITIWTERVQDAVEVSVEDKGIGIPPNSVPKIFRMFERAHSGPQYPGTGIGLTIVRKAVQRMGGTVGVESELGVRTRFWFRLPAVPKA